MEEWIAAQKKLLFTAPLYMIAAQIFGYGSTSVDPGGIQSDSGIGRILHQEPRTRSTEIPRKQVDLNWYYQYYYISATVSADISPLTPPKPPIPRPQCLPPIQIQIIYLLMCIFFYCILTITVTIIIGLHSLKQMTELTILVTEIIQPT